MISGRHPGGNSEEVPHEVPHVVPHGDPPITGVATSVTAFLGRTADGPLGRAHRCRSHADFLRTFRGPHPSSDLADSVRLFFENGGSECHVVRLGSSARRGDDGAPPELADYRGSAADGTGFHALDAVDLFNLLVLPRDRDIPEADFLRILGAASTCCKRNRAMLLIDAPRSWTRRGQAVVDRRAVDGLRELVVPDHAALFYPDLVCGDRGLTRTIGPSGAIAGLMARIDAGRGVWKAPAGLDASLLGVRGLEVELTDVQNGVLNPLAVNCLRVRPTGVVNWGARTLAGADGIGPEWRFIPVRRLALFLEASLERGTRWVATEPNEAPLWARIRLAVGAFMHGLFRQGAFQGDAPDRAYYVRCDGTTTTSQDRDRGIVNIEVGFAPLRPAEFIAIRIRQRAGEP
ncbi:MAG: phage tail sheath family protein [Gemmatimonadales bacterium]|nr:MAG: phage tail sheath family protein [Gemmatimonadales bacterium]